MSGNVPGGVHVSTEALGALLGGAAAVLALLGFGLVLVVLVVANRAEPDPRGLRPFTVYLYGVSFLALVVAFSGSVAVVTGVVGAFAPHLVPVADSVARQCAVGGIVVVLGLGAVAYHLRRGLEIARTDERVDGPNARILHTYVAAVGVVFTVVTVAAAGVAVYLVLELVAPGVFGGGARAATGRTLVEVLYVALAAAVLLLLHLRYGPPRLLPRALHPGGRGAPSTGAPPPPPRSAGAAPAGGLPGTVAPVPEPHESAPLPPFGAPPPPPGTGSPSPPGASPPPGTGYPSPPGTFPPPPGAAPPPPASAYGPPGSPYPVPPPAPPSPGSGAPFPGPPGAPPPPASPWQAPGP